MTITKKNSLSRRSLLHAALVGAGATAFGTSLTAAAARSFSPIQATRKRRLLTTPVCTGHNTPDQPEGPFYPIRDQLDKNNDLTRIERASRHANGKMVYVIGQVTDSDCKPLPGVVVEIWQACASGRYNHEKDPNTAPLDPHFQYFGRCVTDSRGRYLFKTIVPGAYPAGNNWVRPPHIHFRVVRDGQEALITQMYFAGEGLNEKDQILQSLPPEERDALIVEFGRPPTRAFDPKAKVGVFNITLE